MSVQLTKTLPGETTEEFVDRVLGGLMSRTRQAKDRLVAWSDGKPTEKTCEQHGASLVVDWDRSVQWCVNNPDAEPKFVWQKCPECHEIEKLKLDASWMLDRGVPQDITHAAFSNFKLTQPNHGTAIEKAKAFCNINKGFFIMIGGPGTGKTHIAVSILRQAGKGRMITQRQIMDALGRHYDNHGVEDPIDRIKRSSLLVFDELGQSRSGGDVSSSIDSILTYRYEQKLPTVITANLTSKEFVRLIGDRLTSRLDQATFWMGIMTGKSMRKDLKADYFGGQV